MYSKDSFQSAWLHILCAAMLTEQSICKLMKTVLLVCSNKLQVLSWTDGMISTATSRDFNLIVPKLKIVEFANSVDLEDEVHHVKLDGVFQFSFKLNLPELHSYIY